jgi:hypothetical protein
VFWCYVFGVAAGTNGHQEKKDDEPEKETEENAEPAENLEESVKEQTSSEIAEPADAKEVPIEDSKEVSVEDAKEIPVEDPEQENNKDSSIETQQPSKESTEQDASVDPASQNEEVPDNKVFITWLWSSVCVFCLSHKSLFLIGYLTYRFIDTIPCLFVLIHLYFLWSFSVAYIYEFSNLLSARCFFWAKATYICVWHNNTKNWGS